tara:strand:- start:136 stop:342 length:207 start_codon:yes stop_codon:yes gene_type:complete
VITKVEKFIIYRIYYPFTPVNMLTLIHRKMIPKIIGTANRIAGIENLYFSIHLKIILVVPIEKIKEKK